jgi:protease-4
MTEESKPVEQKSDIEKYLELRKKRRLHFLVGALAGALLVCGAVIAAAPDECIEDRTSETGDEVGQTEESCNVYGINLHGDLVLYPTPQAGTDAAADAQSVDEASAEDIVATILGAEADPQTKAIVLEIDSYGGYPVAGEEVAVALRSATKPTVAMIRGAGLSAAYLAAAGAKTIFASKYSDVGGIGVTYSYTDESLKNQREGLTYNSLSTGKFKDTGDQSKPLTAEERALIMRDLGIMHRDFIADVARYRDLAVAAVTALADGSSMLGEAALEKGLIDKIGGLPEVESFLAETIGTKPVICW